MATNGWTGGQYSLFRVILGAWLASRCASWLLQAGARPLLAVGLATGLVLSVYLALGRHDRVAAAAWLALLAALGGSGAAALRPDDVWLAGPLGAHLLVPAAPYGSWAARGRRDPGGGWRMPAVAHAVGWVALAGIYAQTGWVRLFGETPGVPARGLGVLYLGFAPLALVARLRPWLWLLTLAASVALLLVGRAEWGLGLLLLHLCTCDPAWIRPRASDTAEVLFYDGSCGLCHRAVRFLLAEDRAAALRFAPLGGETFDVLVAPHDRVGLPDSIVVRTGNGRYLVRSAAVLHAMARVGGLWRGIAVALIWIPSPLLDRTYDLVAAVRHRLFARPQDVCPVMPDRLRRRFDP